MAHVTGNRRLRTKSSKARLGKRKGRSHYTKLKRIFTYEFFCEASSLFRIRQMMDDRKRSIKLLEQQHAGEIVSERQRR